MNCSMSIPPYFYFSNNILFDFPSSGLVFCSWPGSELGSIKRSILCKMRWRGTTWYNVTVMHISTVIGGKARYHIRRWPYVVWVKAVCTVQVRVWTLIDAHGLFVLANCYTLAGFIFPGGSDHINWEFIMWAYEGRVYLLYIYIHYTHEVSYIYNKLLRQHSLI